MAISCPTAGLLKTLSGKAPPNGRECKREREKSSGMLGPTLSATCVCDRVILVAHVCVCARVRLHIWSTNFFYGVSDFWNSFIYFFLSCTLR